MNRVNIFFTLILSALSFSLLSCGGGRVFDSMKDLDSSVWNENQELTFNIEIPDSTVTYRLYYSVRYDNNYPYYNLYINRTLEDSSGKFLNKKLQGMDLFKPSTGVPFGSGMGSKKDFLILAEDHFKFPYVGKYSVKLKQYMRQENVPGIAAVGFRIEKITEEK
ncbi:MAG TPA: gliding motility lipoprotein GldH [Cytophagaceae bacterium]|jgi:gliding motility-associated lipoprotein GldH|nr:gliding motility lipoprotein GldH [Cytophagaceae bacterium]